MASCDEACLCGTEDRRHCEDDRWNDVDTGAGARPVDDEASWTSPFVVRGDDEAAPTVRRATVRFRNGLRIHHVDGNEVHLPRAERAILSLLVAVDRPVARIDLVESTAISASTLRPALARMPDRLGIDGLVHEVIGGRSGRIALRAGAVVVDLPRIGALADDIVLLGDLGLVVDHPLAVEAVAALRRRLGAPPGA